jgi:hypothetical protein
METCYVTDEHLCLALARNIVFKTCRIISPSSLYTTTKYGLEWVLGQIRATYEPKCSNFVLIGSSNTTSLVARKTGWRYEECKGPSDLSSMIHKISGGK